MGVVGPAATGIEVVVIGNGIWPLLPPPQTPSSEPTAPSACIVEAVLLAGTPPEGIPNSVLLVSGPIAPPA